MSQIFHNVQSAAVFSGAEAPKLRDLARRTGADNACLGHGPLATTIGRLVQVRNQARLGLSVEYLAQSIATQMEARDVEPAPDFKPFAWSNTGRIS